jgi:tetratricopeptide (TPR) repeat protein
VAGQRLAERAFAIGEEAGQPDAVLVYGAQLSFARRYQGHGQESIAVLEQSVNAYPGLPVFRAALASALCWLDRGVEAAAILEKARADRFEHIPLGSVKVSTLALYADAASLTGDAAAASILYRLFEPWADQFVWTATQGYGHARMYMGLLAAVLGEHENADQHFDFACEFHESNGLPLWAARAHLGWAEALAARGDAAATQEHAARALELSREHGYGVFEPRAAALFGAHLTAEA